MADFDHRAKFERELKRALETLGEEQLGDVMRRLGNPPDPSKLDVAFYGALSAELAATIQPKLEAVFLDMAKQTMDDMSIGIEWGIVNQRAAAWANQYTFKLVKGITDNTKFALQESIAGFFKTQMTMGELRGKISVPELKDRLGRIIMPAVRADMIAITEVTRASVQGELEILKEIQKDDPSIKMIAVWQTNRDDWVCAICKPRKGKKRGEDWREDPPAHPRCRCWINHVFEGR